jgi:hypothetical protein
MSGVIAGRFGFDSQVKASQRGSSKIALMVIVEVL